MARSRTGAWLPVTLLLAALPGCDRFPPNDSPAAFVIVPTASAEEGNAVMDAIGAELPPNQRRLVQVRSFLDGSNSSIMVRFAGGCNNIAFVTEVKRIAAAHGTSGVVCVARLPAG